MKHYTFENAAVSLKGLQAAQEYFSPIFADRDREILMLGLCDEELRLLNLHGFPGTRDAVDFKLSEFFRTALKSEFAGIIVAHNHPSGDPHPSIADKALTKRLSIVAEVLDVALLDHLIFDHRPIFSFRQAGLI